MAAPMTPQPGGGILDWLNAPAYAQQGQMPAMMQQAGVTPTSRLMALGQALVGAGRGMGEYRQGGGRGALGGLIGGLSGGLQDYAQGKGRDEEEAYRKLMQQAQIAKALRPEGGQTSEFERLLAGMSPEQQAKLKAGRLEALATENKPPTWGPLNPEQAQAFPGAVSISDRGEPKYPPGEFVTSPIEAERLAIDRMMAQGSLGNAAATRELAQSQAAAAQAQRDIANNQASVSFSASEADRAMARENRERDDVASLRKEFDSKPEVQNYKVILPTYKSAMEANSSKGPGSDLEFVYAVGKILDPASAVREGEQAAIANSQSPANILSGFVDWVQGGNKLTDDQRNQLLQIMDRRARQAHELYKGAADTFSSYAEENYDVHPSRVVRDIGAPPPLPKFGAQAAPVAAGSGMPPIRDFLADEVWPDG